MGYNKEYYQTHKEQCKGYSKKWKQNNLEHCKQIAHEYYEKNKEELYIKQREYQKKNKERFSELCQNSRRRRVEKLREQGVKNAWAVVTKGDKPKYEHIWDINISRGFVFDPFYIVLNKKLVRKERYEMPKVPINYDTNINIRFSSDKLLELKTIAISKGIKYNTLIRNILEEYIEKNKK